MLETLSVVSRDAFLRGLISEASGRLESMITHLCKVQLVVALFYALTLVRGYIARRDAYWFARPLISKRVLGL